MTLEDRAQAQRLHVFRRAEGVAALEFDARAGRSRVEVREELEPHDRRRRRVLRSPAPHAPALRLELCVPKRPFEALRVDAPAGDLLAQRRRFGA